VANRDIIKNLSATRLTTTSTSYQDGLTATGTPTNGSKDFWVLCSAIVDSSSTSRNVNTKLIDSTGAADMCVWNIEPKDATDLMAVFGLAKWTSPVSPVSQSFKLQYSIQTSGTAGVDEMCIVAIESATGDQYIETNAETTTTSASYQDAQTLTFTPPTQGDYLIIAYAETNCSSTTAGSVQLDVDGTVSHISDPQDLSDVANYMPYIAVTKVQLAASSRTIKIQFKSNGSATARIRRRRILAIRCDTLQLVSTDYTSTRATTSSTSASPADAASTTFTAAGSVDYFAISNVVLDHPETTTSVSAQTTMDGSVVASHTREPVSTSAERPYAAINYSAFAAGSRTVKTRVHGESGFTSSGYADRGIYVLDLREAVAAGGTLTAAQGSYTLTGQAVALKASRQLLASLGTFALTGQAMTPKYGRTAVLAQESLALTGQAANLKAARQLVAAYGPFALTGQAANLKAARQIVLDYGPVALTGQNVTLTYTPSTGSTLAIGQGSFALTGQALTLAGAHRLALDYGSLSLAGQALALKAARQLVMGQVAVTLTGQAATLRAARQLVLANGSAVLTGQGAALKAARQLLMGQGSVALAGQNVTLTYAPVAVGYTLAMGQGSLTLTGQALAFSRGFRLALDSGAMALTGQVAALKASRQIVLAAGSLTLTGEAVALRHAAALILAQGGYMLAGQGISLRAARQLLAAYGAYLLTGDDMALRSSRIVILSARLGIRPALAGDVETAAALDGGIDIQPALAGDTDIRPALDGFTRLRPALAGTLNTGN